MARSSGKSLNKQSSLAGLGEDLNEQKAVRLLKSRLTHDVGWTFVGNLRDNHLVILNEAACEEGINTLLGGELEAAAERRSSASRPPLDPAMLGGAFAARSLGKLTDSDATIVCLGDSRRVLGHTVISQLLKRSVPLEGLNDEEKIGGLTAVGADLDFPFTNRFRTACYVLREFAQLPTNRVAFPHMTEMVFDKEDRCLGMMIQPSFGPVHCEKPTEHYRVFGGVVFENSDLYVNKSEAALEFEQEKKDFKAKSKEEREAERMIEKRVIEDRQFQRVLNAPGRNKGSLAGAGPRLSLAGSQRASAYTLADEQSALFQEAGVTLANSSLRKAFAMLDIQDKNVVECTRVLAGLMILNKIQFAEVESPTANRLTKKSVDRAKAAAKMLGVDPEDLIAFLTFAPVKTSAAASQRSDSYSAGSTSGNGGRTDLDVDVADRSVGDADLVGAASPAFLQAELQRFIRVVYTRLYYRFVLRGINRCLTQQIAPVLNEVTAAFSDPEIKGSVPVDSPAIIPCQARPGCLTEARRVLKERELGGMAPHLCQSDVKSVVSVIDGLSDVHEPCVTDSWTNFFKNLAFEKFQGVFEAELDAVQRLYKREGVRFAGKQTLADLQPAREERVGLMENMNMIADTLDNFLHAPTEEGRQHRQTARRGGNLDKEFHESLVQQAMAVKAHAVPAKKSLRDRAVMGGSERDTSAVTFQLIHYTEARIEYNFETWVARNERSLSANGESLLRGSSVNLVRVVLSGGDAENLLDFSKGVAAAGPSSAGPTTGGKNAANFPRSFASCFRKKMNDMLSTIQAGSETMLGNEAALARAADAAADSTTATEDDDAAAGAAAANKPPTQETKLLPPPRTHSLKFIRLLMPSPDVAEATQRAARVSTDEEMKARPFSFDDKFVSQQMMATKTTNLFQLLGPGFDWRVPHEPLCRAFQSELLTRKQRKSATLDPMNPIEAKTRFVLLNTDDSSPHHGSVMQGSGGAAPGSGAEGNGNTNSQVVEFLEILLNLCLRAIMHEHRMAFLREMEAQHGNADQVVDEETEEAEGGLLEMTLAAAPARLTAMQDVMVGKTLLFLHARHRRVYVFLQELLAKIAQGRTDECRQRLGLTKGGLEAQAAAMQDVMVGATGSASGTTGTTTTANVTQTGQRPSAVFADYDPQAAARAQAAKEAEKPKTMKERRQILQEFVATNFKRPPRRKLVELVKEELAKGNRLESKRYIQPSEVREGLPHFLEFKEEYKRPSASKLKVRAREEGKAGNVLERRSSRAVVIDLTDEQEPVSGSPAGRDDSFDFTKSEGHKEKLESTKTTKVVVPREKLAASAPEGTDKMVKAEQPKTAEPAAVAPRPSRNAAATAPTAAVAANTTTAAPPASASPPVKRRVSKSSGLVRRMSQQGGSLEGYSNAVPVTAKPKTAPAASKMAPVAGKAAPKAGPAAAVAAGAGRTFRGASAAGASAAPVPSAPVPLSAGGEHVPTLKERMAAFQQAAQPRDSGK